MTAQPEKQPAAAQPEEQPAAAQPEEQVPEQVPLYRSASVDALAFEPIEREGKVYVVRMSPRLVVQTPVLTLTSPLVDDDGEPLPFATFAVPAPFAAWVRRVEARVQDACVAHKSEWFRKDIDDDALRAGFKSFLRPNGTLKVKVPEEAAVFGASKQPLAPGDVPVGSHVRAVVDVSKICFGKTEFGAAWKLVQLRAVAVPRCLIDDAAESDAESENADFL